MTHPDPTKEDLVRWCAENDPKFDPCVYLSVDYKTASYKVVILGFRVTCDMPDWLNSRYEAERVVVAEIQKRRLYQEFCHHLAVQLGMPISQNDLDQTEIKWDIWSVVTASPSKLVVAAWWATR